MGLRGYRGAEGRWAVEGDEGGGGQRRGGVQQRLRPVHGRGPWFEQLRRANRHW